MGRLKDRVALVTGSGRGFGRAMAMAYAREGANVVVVARSVDELASAEEAMMAEGGEVLTVSADISTDEGIGRVVERALDEYGGLDVLVNNAATSPWLTFEETTIEHWDRVIAVNLRAPFALTKMFLPSMKERGGGSVVNISSRSAELGFVAESAYCPSKYGLEGLTQCLALELRPHNVAVNSLNVSAPEGLRLKPTEMTLRQAEDMPEEERRLYVDDESLVECFGDAWTFLALQRGDGVTGQRLSTRVLAETLRSGGEDAAYERWRGKLVHAVYTPVDWPRKVRYQTPDGGWREIIFR
jgi:NAD(P)-dependent dehydrogenase (short-subunit alcohol dehydrogenase family)